MSTALWLAALSVGLALASSVRLDALSGVFLVIIGLLTIAVGILLWLLLKRSPIPMDKHRWHTCVSFDGVRLATGGNYLLCGGAR